MRGRGRRQVLVAAQGGPSAVVREGDADTLAPFDSRERGEWWWRQPRWSKRAWTLEAGGRTVAVLEGETLFSSTSRVRFADAAFEVRRSWTGNGELRPAGGGEPVARFVTRWTGDGRILSEGEAPLELVARGFWHRTIELRTTDELPIVRFESHNGLARHELQVVLEDTARRRKDLPALLTLATTIVFTPKRH